MNEKNLQSWTEFDDEIERLLQAHLEHKKLDPSISDIVFRGQANSDWKLETTMERNMRGRQKITTYYNLADSVKNRIETFTNKTWEKWPDFHEIEKWIETNFSPTFGIKGGLLGYEYIAYLRHHGFPSPLLDWSLSPYVAAYFAFKDVQRDVENVAIFAYIEHLGIKVMGEGDARIKLLGPYITTDKRHFLQQCRYTICTGFHNNLPYFLSHEEVFEKSSGKQDILYKFVLPASQREQALRKLEMFNINDYSLFGSEESLMQTVFLREHIMKM